MKTYKKIIYGLAAVALLSSAQCEKQNIVCTGNCYSLNVNGTVINSLTNTNAPNVPLIIQQVKFTGTFASSRIVQEFSSGSDGRFNELVAIDTTMFQNGYFLRLRVKENDEYMTLPERAYRDYSLSDHTANHFNNVKFFVYPKVNLKIKLNRVQNDDFKSFSITYYFVDNEGFFPFSILSPQDINKTEIVVPTSSDIFTKIRVTKGDSNGIYTSTLDSIMCTKGGENTYTVSF